MKQTPQEFFRSQARSFLFATEAIARYAVVNSAQYGVPAHRLHMALCEILSCLIPKWRDFTCCELAKRLEQLEK